MIELELSSVSGRIVEQLLGVEPDDEVVVVSDPEKAAVGKAVTAACRGVGAEANFLVMPRLDSHGNEPNGVVQAAMTEADVAFTATTHAITHTRARLAASEAGTRIAVLRGVTEDMMVSGGLSTDFDALRERTEAVRDVLDAASTAHVTSPEGTDVTMDLEGRSAFSLDGYFHEEYGFATLPPGESPTSPAEGTAEGTVVVDYSMDGVGALEDPIRLTFEEGVVTDVRGGNEASELRHVVEEADENAGNLAEFAIGTNPDARLVGNLAEDKKRLGTVHFAIGDNESLGGSVRSDIHLDGLVLDPTVRLDGRLVVDDGELRTEQIRDIGEKL